VVFVYTAPLSLHGDMGLSMSTKDKIIQTSIALFNQHGERAITTNHIAQEMGISPGNLYYHFKNKEHIIREIFYLYRSHLEQHFVPLSAEEPILEQLTHYLDSLFELMWRFNFFYDNLADILSRDAKLKEDYMAQQKNLLVQVSGVIKGLKAGKVIAIDDADIEDLAHTVKLVVSAWTSYVKTHSAAGKLQQQDIYQGIGKVILLFKPYAVESGYQQLTQLQAAYQQKQQTKSVEALTA
jgi:AcrR family transcriptional regulator